MTQQFIAQLEHVCRRRRRRRLLSASCWALVAITAAGLAIMAFDRALEITDPVARTLASIVFVGMFALVIRRWLSVVSKYRVTPLQIAQEVERRYPQMRDFVASAWDFAQQADDDVTSGSVSLRRAIVLRAATAVDEVDWQQLVSRQPLRQAAFAFTGVAIAISIAGWLLPEAMGVGLTRLMNPMSVAEWPRANDLQFIEPPTLLAAGDDLVLELHDTRGALPSTVTMHYRTLRPGRRRDETKTLAVTSDPLEIRRSNVRESLQYRATGGDHETMRWQTLEVVAPPRVENLQVTVHPPEYTRLPALPWDKSATIYAGSMLRLRGRTDQPVAGVELHSSSGERRAAQIDSDRHTFYVDKADWRVEDSVTYGIQLTTSDGLTISDATELALDVVVDQPPRVRLVQPTENLTVLPAATVPLVVEADDELAVREIELAYLRSDRSIEGDQIVSLWQAADDPSGNDAARRQRVGFSWRLAPLSLVPGSTVEFRAQASDAQPATGQTARALRLNVVSEEELWRQIVSQQKLLVEQLVRLLGEQREVRGITADWSTLPAWSAARWAGASHAALYRQRQIASALAGGQNSVLWHLAQLSEMIERNHLIRPDAVDRLRAAQAVLQNLIDDPLAVVEQSMSELVRQSQQSAELTSLRPLIVATGERQDEVIAGVERAIDLLMPGNILGRIERELAVLTSDQDELAEHCRSDITPHLLQWDDANADQQAALVSAIRRQRELARRLAELMLDMTQAADRLADDEPIVATRLAETVALGVKLGTQVAIQGAANQLAQRRAGRSASLQRQVLEDLEKLRTCLSGQDVQAGAERFKNLQAAERKLERLRRQLAAQEDELARLSPEQRQRELERLRRQQEAIAKETEEFSRQLMRLRVPRAAEAANKAASQMRRATLDSESAKAAKQQLDTAQRELTDARRRQQVALARLQMAQLDTKLNAFVGRQQSIQQEIVRLDHARVAAGRLSEAQRQTVIHLADRQAELRAEVIRQAVELTSLPVFAHLLKMAGETMQSVADDLQQAVIDQPTQILIEQAVGQLVQLAEAVQQEQQNLSSNSPGSGGGEGQSGDTAQSQTLQLALGQLHLLKTLQTTLHEKTRSLESGIAAGEPPSHSADELARQQQQLLDLAREFVLEPPDPPADKLFPDLEQELERSLEDITLPRPNSEIQP